MTPEHGAANDAAVLLSALADPTVLVDDGGLIAAWNAAAAARFGLIDAHRGQPQASVLGGMSGSARRLSLAGRGGSLLVWHADPLDPDDLVLQRQDALGRLAGGISHDIAGKYTALLGYAGIMAAEPGVPDDLVSTATQLEAIATDTLSLIRNALEFARHQGGDVGLVSVAEVVERVMELVAHPLTNMEHRSNVPASLAPVQADPVALHQALVAIMLNAVEAMGGEWARGATPAVGRIVVTGSEFDDAAGHRIRLSILDSASRLSDEERRTLFAGSGSSRSTRDLVVARALIQQAGGRLTCEPVATGNRVVVEIPVAGTVLPPEPQVPELGVSEPPLILICDDEPLIRGLMVRFMDRQGHRTIEARRGGEALEILDAGAVALVIADQTTPDMPGAELYLRAIARRPELAARFILMSADPGSAEVAEFAARTGVPVLAKPFDAVLLAQLVRDALGE